MATYEPLIDVTRTLPQRAARRARADRDGRRRLLGAPPRPARADPGRHRRRPRRPRARGLRDRRRGDHDRPARRRRGGWRALGAARAGLRPRGARDGDART